jgi:hypothetical protein
VFENVVFENQSENFFAFLLNNTMQNIFTRCCSGQNSSECRGTNCCTKTLQQQQQQQQHQEQQQQQQQQVLNNGLPDLKRIKPDVLPLRSPLRSPRTKKIFKRLSDIVIEEEVEDGNIKLSKNIFGNLNFVYCFTDFC